MVCFGNICRSPMAEALLQRALDERLGEGHDVLVSSAGVAATEGLPPSQGSIRAMRSYGIDIHRSRSRELTPSMAQRADLIYCMESYQVDRVRAMLPAEQSDRVRLMGDEVPDPLGAGQPAYDAVADQIEKLLPGVIEQVVAYLNGSK